jgi:acetate kinase
MNTMKVLVINSGSSSLKYQLLDMRNETLLAKGNCERIGIDGKIVHKAGGGSETIELPLPDHLSALREAVSLLSEGDKRVVSDRGEIVAVGHRIAAGDDKTFGAMEVNEEVLRRIEGTLDLAPLHVPAMLAGIRACTQIFGSSTTQVAVFDTSFHLTMPPKAFMYAIPYEFYEKYGFRRFGYHGTSHKFVSRRVAELMGKDKSRLKVITCHLGNGSSICAVDGGKSVDTTMGYTPLEGLIMGTRSGSIDPSLLYHIAKKEGVGLEEVNDILNKRSGLLGITGLSSDDRDIGLAAEEGNPRAILAADMVRYQIKKFIGAYTAAMGGLDAVVFTGGIGEKSAELRRDVCANMEYLGISLDNGKNFEQNGKECDIALPGSKVRVWIVPTNEELMIARDTAEVYGAKNKG